MNLSMKRTWHPTHLLVWALSSFSFSISFTFSLILLIFSHFSLAKHCFPFCFLAEKIKPTSRHFIILHPFLTVAGLHQSSHLAHGNTFITRSLYFSGSSHFCAGTLIWNQILKKKIDGFFNWVFGCVFLCFHFSENCCRNMKIFFKGWSVLGLYFNDQFYVVFLLQLILSCPFFTIFSSGLTHDKMVH